MHAWSYIWYCNSHDEVIVVELWINAGTNAHTFDTESKTGLQDTHLYLGWLVIGKILFLHEHLPCLDLFQHRYIILQLLTRHATWHNNVIPCCVRVVNMRNALFIEIATQVCLLPPDMQPFTLQPHPAILAPLPNTGIPFQQQPQQQVQQQLQQQAQQHSTDETPTTSARGGRKEGKTNYTTAKPRLLVNIVNSHCEQPFTVWCRSMAGCDRRIQS